MLSLDSLIQKNEQSLTNLLSTGIHDAISEDVFGGYVLTRYMEEIGWFLVILGEKAEGREEFSNLILENVIAIIVIFALLFIQLTGKITNTFTSMLIWPSIHPKKKGGTVIHFFLNRYRYGGVLSWRQCLFAAHTSVCYAVTSTTPVPASGTTYGLCI